MVEKGRAAQWSASWRRGTPAYEATHGVRSGSSSGTKASLGESAGRKGITLPGRGTEAPRTAALDPENGKQELKPVGTCPAGRPTMPDGWALLRMTPAAYSVIGRASADAGAVRQYHFEPKWRMGGIEPGVAPCRFSRPVPTVARPPVTRAPIEDTYRARCARQGGSAAPVMGRVRRGDSTLRRISAIRLAGLASTGGAPMICAA